MSEHTHEWASGENEVVKGPIWVCAVCHAVSLGEVAPDSPQGVAWRKTYTAAPAPTQVAPDELAVRSMATYLGQHDKGRDEDIILDGEACRQAGVMLRDLLAALTAQAATIAERDDRIAALRNAVFVAEEVIAQERSALAAMTLRAEARRLACERARGCIGHLVAGKPVRDVTETLAELDAAIAGEGR